MTKQLIIGLATIAVTGAAILATGMYAATDSTNASRFMHMGNMRGNPPDLVATLSGKVSTEAITALQTLMTKHKTEMDTARSNTGVTVNKATMEANRTAFKTEMDALFTRYPELKAAMPNMGKWGMMGHGNGEIEAIMATLPEETQNELKAIHDEYKTKLETLKTEEKTKTDAIFAKYPEIKTKLDALHINWPQEMGWREHSGKGKGMGRMMNR